MFRNLAGYVYILENELANRVKVGMSTNNVCGRLEDANNMWLDRKITCQICGALRLIRNDGYMPKHLFNGKTCPGGGVLPLERDVQLAEQELNQLKILSKESVGVVRGTAVRRMNSLEKRIALYRNRAPLRGEWRLNTVFQTDCAEKVELLAHELLTAHLDAEAPFGEVFSCSVLEATTAVEAALAKLGLSATVEKA